MINVIYLFCDLHRVKSAILKKDETVNNLRKQHEVRDSVFLSEHDN